MKRLGLKSIPFILILLLQFLLIPSLNAQSINSILDKPGGSGSGNVSNDDGNSNAGLYILAGAAIAAILIYKFVLEEPSAEEPEENEEDSQRFSINNLEKDLSYYKNELPVDIFFGLKQSTAVTQDQSLVMGVALKF